MATTNARMFQRRRTAAEWTSEDPVLGPSEFGVEEDTGRFKIGNGSTAWTALPYASLSSGEVVLLTGNQTKDGTLTFTSSPTVPNPAAVDNSAVSRQEAAATAAFLAQTAVDGLPELASSDPAKMPMSTAGGVTTLDVERLAPEVAYLTADSAPVNDSTTLVDVTGLAVPVAANAVYVIEGFLSYNTNGAADAKFGWTIPAGATGKWNPIAINPGTAGSVSSVNVASRLWTETLPAGGSDTTPLTVHIMGLLVVGGTAGVLQAQFAQNTATVTDTVVQAHSWVTALRVG